MTIPRRGGFRRGGLWREFFITFSTYAYMRTFLIKTPNNPPHQQTHHRRRHGNSFLRGAACSRDLTGEAAQRLEMSLCACSM